MCFCQLYLQSSSYGNFKIIIMKHKSAAFINDYLILSYVWNLENYPLLLFCQELYFIYNTSLYVYHTLVFFKTRTKELKGPSSYGSWIYNYLCNQCLSPLTLWVRIWIRARCTTLYDKVCQWLVTGRWFSPGPPVSSTNKTDRHDITEILNKQTKEITQQTHVIVQNYPQKHIN